MGTTADKLTYLNETKKKIKEAVGSKSDKFRDYIEEINHINQVKNQALANQKVLETEGEDIYVKDSAEMPCKLEIMGNTKQETREGYNLIDNIAQDASGNGVTFKVNEDKSITITGTTTQEIRSYVIAKNITFKAGTYILDIKNKTATFGIYLVKNGANFTYLGMADTATFKSFTVSEDTTFDDLHLYTTAGQKINITIYPMIYKGTTEKPYEQYGAMPSINYPSPIKVVEGSYANKIQNKNLFNINNITENQYVDYKGNTGNSSVTNTSDFIKVYKSQKVCLSYKYNTLANTGTRSFCLYDENKKVVAGGGDYNPSVKEKSITIYQDGYIKFSYDKNCYDIKLEYGDIATDYVEHQEQTKNLDFPQGIQLAKEDELQFSYTEKNGYKTIDRDSVYYVKNKDIQDLKNATFSFIADTFDTNRNRFITQELVGKIKPSTLVLCNRFVGSISSSDLYINNRLVNPSSGKISFYNSDIKTLDEWNTFVSENDLYVLYELATPVKTQITDETFINQLEDFLNSSTYEGGTKIYTISESGANPILKLKYYMSINALTNTILELGESI